MSKKRERNGNAVPGFAFIKKVGGISEYRLKNNGLSILYKRIKGTGIVTTNITYLVGARDESVGETGIAHMLEHMLFMPTKSDIKVKTGSGAMHFERETGCILNANTCKDRTTYFFSYPVEHFERALSIEADRMLNVVLNDAVFKPEQGNVLSEFDMYNGDPHFALAVQLVSSAFHSHTYGHETIGYREDIEAYTVEKLQRFYKNYYRPNNATLMVVGDIDEIKALNAIKRIFGSLQNSKSPIHRHSVNEPIQEGVRRVEIVRPSTTNILALGIKHAAFPSKEWFATMTFFSLLAGGPDSILHKKLIDTGLASSIDTILEPTRDINLGVLFVTLTKKISHEKMELPVLKIIQELKSKDITKQAKKVLKKTITDEFFTRENSLGIVRELTEYTAAGDWAKYYETEEILHSITTKDIVNVAKTMFEPERMTIGYFRGLQT